MKKNLSFMMLPLVLSALIAFAFVVERLFGLSFVESGIYPRSLSGIKGILFAPFIHGDLEHLISNITTLPVLMGMLTYVYRRNYVLIFSTLWVATGILVWIFARESFHIGVSGIIYALAAFLFFGGIISGRRANVVMSVLVIFLYGGMVWGVLPYQPHVSWESHLMGGASGFFFAFVFVRPARTQEVSDIYYDYRMPGFSKPGNTGGFENINYLSN